LFPNGSTLDGFGARELDALVATAGATHPNAQLGLEGSVFEGRFRVEQRIAEGGFAIVYRAWQLALERPVALKVLKAPRNHDEAARAEFRDRFAVEAKTIARLRHRHIVDVYDFAVATLPSGELAPWMALEWLEGETLAVHLERRRRSGLLGRDPSEAVEFVRPVLEALAHAHTHGIAHRDIKPSNVMVTATQSGTSLRVLDFGIAKIMVDDQAPNTGNTRTESTPAFSPAYAAPEQVAFSRTGPWTDVHAVGLLLSELMSDEPPFSDPDPEAHLFEQVMARKRPTPGSKGRDVGPFEPILAKALALAPRDRWRNVSELLAALDEVSARGSTLALSLSDTAPAVVGRVERARPPVTKNRPALALALALAGALGVVAVIVNAKHAPPTEPDVPPPALPRSAPQAPLKVALPVPIQPAPEASAPPIATMSAAEPVIPAHALSPARPRANVKKSASLPPPPTPPGDGRDLFNDTK
jgi:serine/threonine protein kinase